MTRRKFYFDQEKVSANRAKKLARGGLATYAGGGQVKHFNEGQKVVADGDSAMTSASPRSDEGKAHGEVKDKMAVISKATQNLQAMPTPNAMNFAKMREQIASGGGAEFRQQLPNILLAEAERAEQARANQRAELQKQIDNPNNKWAEAERLFRVSSALAQPSATGGMGATLANFGKAGAEYATSKSAEEKAQKDLKMKMLELEGMDPKTAANLIKIGESQKAEDEAGRIADSLGLVGQERKDFIKKHYKEKHDLEVSKVNATLAANAAKANAISPKEQDKLLENNDKIGSSNLAIASIDEALKLNEQAFGTYAKPKQFLATYLTPDLLKTKELKKAMIATTTMETAGVSRALGQLRATFGGNPTEGERKILVDLENSMNKSPEQRAAALREIRHQLEQRAKLAAEQNKQIRAGAFGKSSGRDHTDLSDDDLLKQYSQPTQPQAQPSQSSSKGKK